MKNHKKYAKLPQDLDLSFQQQLDVDTAATDDFNLTGSGLDDDDDNILGDQDAAADDEDEVIEDDDEEDEVVYATAAAAATGLSGTGSCGLRLVGATAAARKQQLNKKVLSGLGRDSVIEASAYSTHTRYVRDINTEKTEILKSYDVNAFYAAFEHFMEGLRIVCPEPVYNFFQKVYETCKRIGELVPSELPTSFYNVYTHWPTYKQFFTEEFINAVEHLFRTIKDVVVPPQIWAFVNATWENFPKITDYIKPELFNSIGAHLQKVPFVRECLKNTYMVLEQLLQHSRP